MWENRRARGDRSREKELRSSLAQQLEPRRLFAAIACNSPGEVDMLPVPQDLVAPVLNPTGGPNLSLSSVPQLHSLSGAADAIYLDFVGAPAQTWGAYSVPATPAFDQDGDPTTFSAGELSAIQEAWARVAEKYSPFNIDVSTVAPASLVHRKNMEAVIGGNGAGAEDYTADCPTPILLPAP